MDGPDVRDDAEVIGASLDDAEAFGVLFDRHARRLHAFLARRVDRATADSLLGEVFRIAFERRRSFDRSRPDALPWLFGISSRLVAKEQRRAGRHAAAMGRLAGVAGAGAGAGATGSPPMDAAEDALDARRLLERAQEVIAALPGVEREALLLFAWEELGYDEIAAALEVPVGTVRSRLHRARTSLRELLAPTGEDDGDHRDEVHRRCAQ